MTIVEKNTTPVLKEYQRIWSQVILETIHPAVGTRNFAEFEWNMKFNEEKTRISLGFLMILQDVTEIEFKNFQKISVRNKDCDKQAVCQEFLYDEKTTTVQDLIRYSVKIIKDALNNSRIKLKTLAPRLSTYNFNKVINDSFRLNDLKNGDYVLSAEGNVGVVIKDIKNFDIVFNDDYVPGHWYNEYLEMPSIPEYNIVKVLRHNHCCGGLKAVQEALKSKSQKNCDNRIIPFDKTNSFYITEEKLKRKIWSW
jgi:hypothetical protein